MQANPKDLRGWRRALQRAGLAYGGRVDPRHLYGYIGAVTAALLVLIGAALVFGRSMLVPPPLHIDAAAPAGVRPSGQFLRRLPDGHTCRYTVFDNNLGQASQDKLGRCEEVLPPPAGPGETAASKLDIRPHRFSWGGR